ncbi:MAG: Pilus assembly protein PilO [Acidimicrobiaceae bacterium]|nr:Pilus assembly protein PilO [Acidimicrobiaceae bacterium]
MNKRVIAIAVAASVVLIGIWYVAVFSAQSKSVKKAHSQESSAKSQAQSLRSQIAVLQREKADLPASTAKLTTLKLSLPDTPALDKLIDDVNAAAAASGVDWQTITPAKPATFAAGSGQAVAAGFPGGMQSVTVAMQVNGTYKQITDFVVKLNGLSRLLDVGSINLSGIGGATKSTGQITTQIFFVPPAAGSVPVTTTTAAP